MHFLDPSYCIYCIPLMCRMLILLLFMWLLTVIVVKLAGFCYTLMACSSEVINVNTLISFKWDLFDLIKMSPKSVVYSVRRIKIQFLQFTIHGHCWRHFGQWKDAILAKSLIRNKMSPCKGNPDENVTKSQVYKMINLWICFRDK